MASTGRKLESATILAQNAEGAGPFSDQLNGCDAVVLLVHRLHDHLADVHVIVTFDVRNAFNSVSRLHGLMSIAQAIPGLYTYNFSTYKRINKLWMQSVSEWTRQSTPSEEGTTQRAVDGAIFFNATLSHVLKEVNVLSQEQTGCSHCGRYSWVYKTVKGQAHIRHCYNKISIPVPSNPL